MDSKLIFILQKNKVFGRIQAFSQEVESRDKSYLREHKEAILELLKGALENVLD